MKWYNPLYWVPYSQPGRQTLIYVMFAGAGPALLLTLIWAMHIIRNWQGAPAILRLDKFADIAMLIAWALLIVVVAYSAFAAIRSLKFDPKNGISMEARDDDEPIPVAVTNTPANPVPVVDEAKP